jgi:hypothetical protein
VVGRYLIIFVAGTAFSVLVSGTALAQRPPRGHGPDMRFAQQGGRDRAVRPMPDRWREMAPQDRMRFRANAERWQQMDGEQRRILRDREQMRMERIRRETDAALRQSGLQLEAERRQQYEQRYMQEQRRIEEALRRELREKRQRELAPVVEQLKREFSQQQQQGNATPGKAEAAAPSPKTKAAPSPKK